MTIRGFNADKEAAQILDDLEIPKMGFSKQMNKIVKEWSNETKTKQLEKLNPSVEVKLIG